MTARLSAAALALALCSGCGAAASGRYLNRANGVGGSLTTADVASVPVRGAQVFVDCRDGSTTQGELLAANSQGVIVLEPTDTIADVSADRIDNVEVVLYSSGSGLTAVWTVFGTLSTLSHGYLLFLSAPIWILTGTIASAGSRSESKLDVPVNWLSSLYQFARFPQGLPPGFVTHWYDTRHEAASWLSNEPE